MTSTSNFAKGTIKSFLSYIPKMFNLIIIGISLGFVQKCDHSEGASIHQSRAVITSNLYIYVPILAYKRR